METAEALSRGKDWEKTARRALVFARAGNWDLEGAEGHEITGRSLDAVRARLLRDHGWKGSTANRYQAAFCGLWRRLGGEVRGRCSWEPESRRELVPSPEEVERLLSCNPPGLDAEIVGETKDALRMLQGTGLRRGEVLGLTLQDVVKTAECLVVTLQNTKTGVNRQVPVPRALEALVLRKLSEALQREIGPGGARRPRGQEKLFRVPPSTLSRVWRALREEAGLPEQIVPHTLRHARITELAEKGVPVPTVAALVGHSSWKTTQRYYHASMARLMEAANA